MGKTVCLLGRVRFQGRIGGRGDSFDARETVEIGRRRVEMLKKYGILDQG